MLIKRQQCASISTLFPTKRKSATFHITKLHLKRSSFKASADFNSQILSNENSQDFSNIVGSITHILDKQKPILKPEEERTTTSRNEDATPLKIVRYPTIKCSAPPKQLQIKPHRYPTEPAYSLSPTHYKMHLPSKLTYQETMTSFKRYESPSNYSHERKKHGSRNLPQINLRKQDSIVETVNPQTGEIIKPWQTRRDLFHETFKRYIAEHTRASKWVKGDKPTIL